MKRNIAVAALLLGAVLSAEGCVGRAISEGLGVALGAKGKVVVLQPIIGADSKPLGEYRQFVIEPFADGMDGQAPAQISQDLPRFFAKELRADRIPDATDGKTLLVRGKIVHYETHDTIDQAFGPLEEVVARVELVDKDTGKVVGVANCIGRTKESTMTGVQTKAEGLAKAIAGWIGKNYPDHKRTPKKERGEE